VIVNREQRQVQLTHILQGKWKTGSYIGEQLGKKWPGDPVPCLSNRRVGGCNDARGEDRLRDDEWCANMNTEFLSLTVFRNCNSTSECERYFILPHSLGGWLIYQSINLSINQCTMDATESPVLTQICWNFSQIVLHNLPISFPGLVFRLRAIAVTSLLCHWRVYLRKHTRPTQYYILGYSNKSPSWWRHKSPRNIPWWMSKLYNTDPWFWYWS